MDLAKMRERQERLAAIAREEARCVLLQKLLVKYGVDARHPEYFSYLPSIVLQGLLVGFRCVCVHVVGFVFLVCWPSCWQQRPSAGEAS
jgi:protein-S-isoprenylcysteine O-methyltransferase Ste14